MILKLGKRELISTLLSLVLTFQVVAQEQSVTFFGLQLRANLVDMKEGAAKGDFTCTGPEVVDHPYPDVWGEFDLVDKYFKQRSHIDLSSFNGKHDFKLADSYEVASSDGNLSYKLYFYDDSLFRVDRKFWFEKPGDLKRLLDATRQKYGRPTDQKQTADVISPTIRYTEYVWKQKSMIVCLRCQEEYIDSLIEPASWVPKSARITYFDIKLQNDIVAAQNRYVDQVNRGQKDVDTSNL